MIADAVCTPRRSRDCLPAAILGAVLLTAGAVMLIVLALTPLPTEGAVGRAAHEVAPDAVFVSTVDELQEALHTDSRVVIISERPDVSCIVWPAFWTCVLTTGLFLVVAATGERRSR